MDRRRFGLTLLNLIGGFVFAPSLLSAFAREDRWRVNGLRLNEHLKKLSGIGATDSGGSNRVAFSDSDRAARDYVMDLMRDAGLQSQIDAAGNIVGRRKGQSADLPPLMLGSHIDSVPEGGNYDGPVGVMAAIEVAQTLQENGHATRHPLEIIVFCNEEGGKTGSRLLIGEVMEKEFDIVTASGKTIREGIRFLGGDPERLSEARRRPGDIAAYLELHIEQGAILQDEGVAIGVVEGIVGIKRWNVTITGFANHAGTTPMNKRQDAMLAAARFIKQINRIVADTPGRQVGTVGRIHVRPGAPNVIPGEVQLSLEIRDLEMEKIDRLFQDITKAAGEIAQETGVAFAYDHFYTSKAALTDDRIRQVIADAADELGLKTKHLPSGAGHDAQSIAQLAPIGMIFIPSVDGISHSPREFSHPDDITNGANTLLLATLRLDQMLD